MWCNQDMKGGIGDIRHALRVYARTPFASGFTVVVLAVAVAFVGSFLSLYIDLVFKPTPGFADSRDLVTIGQNDGGRLTSVSLELIERINDEVASLDRLAGFGSGRLEVGEDRESLPVEFLSAGFFEAARPELVLGRGFTPTEHEPGGEPVAILSYRYWQREFGASADVLGRTVAITGMQQYRFPGPDGQPAAPAEEQTTDFRIVGVMSDAIPSLTGNDVAMWVPFEVGAPLYLGPFEQVRGFQLLRGLGRRSPGASPVAIAAELTDRYQLAGDLNINSDQPFDAYPGLVLDINAQRSARQQLQLFLAGSLLVAFVAALIGLNAFAIDMMLPALGQIGDDLGVGAGCQLLQVAPNRNQRFPFPLHQHHRQAQVGAIGLDHPQQRLFATEKMRTAGQIDGQPRRRRLAHPGAELARPAP